MEYNLTFTDLCEASGITPPIKKKIDRLVEHPMIKQKVGKRCFYANSEVTFYRTVRQLRMLDFSYTFISVFLNDENFYKDHLQDVYDRIDSYCNQFQKLKMILEELR